MTPKRRALNLSVIFACFPLLSKKDVPYFKISDTTRVIVGSSVTPTFVHFKNFFLPESDIHLCAIVFIYLCSYLFLWTEGHIAENLTLPHFCRPSFESSTLSRFLKSLVFHAFLIAENFSRPAPVLKILTCSCLVFKASSIVLLLVLLFSRPIT